MYTNIVNENPPSQSSQTKTRFDNFVSILIGVITVLFVCGIVMSWLSKQDAQSEAGILLYLGGGSILLAILLAPILLISMIVAMVGRHRRKQPVVQATPGEKMLLDRVVLKAWFVVVVMSIISIGGTMYAWGSSCGYSGCGFAGGVMLIGGLSFLLAYVVAITMVILCLCMIVSAILHFMRREPLAAVQQIAALAVVFMVVALLLNVV